MNKYIRSLTGLMLAAGLFGCSVRKADPTINRDPVDPTAPIVKAEEETETRRRLSRIELREDPEVSANAVTADAILNDSLLPLKALLFDPVVFQDVTEIRSNKFRLAIAQFNADIIHLAKADKKKLDESGVLKEYEDILSFDCPKLRGTCSTLYTFQGDVNFSGVLKLMAKEPGVSTEHYYELLRIALEQPLAYDDQDLYAMYLVKSDTYNNELLEAQKKSTSPAIAEAIRRHQDNVANLWQLFNPKLADPKDIATIMDGFSWEISRKKDTLTAGMDRKLQLAASRDLYLDEAKTQPNPAFGIEVEKILNAKSEIYGDGIGAIYSEINSGFSKGILKNLGIEGAIPNDEYMYLMDRIYNGHFSSEDQLAFWEHTAKDKERLISAVMLFAKIMIANRVVWTNQEMSKFFEREAPNHKSVIPLLMAAIANGVKMYAVWDNTRDSIEKLDLFVAERFGKIDAKALPLDNPYRIFNDSVVGLTNNIKMLSVYPNMMMLVYAMAKNDFNAKIKTWWGGEVTITASQIVKSFFVDTMTPWFNFGTDREALTQIELLYAVHFAMQTETFKAFTGNKELQVDNIGFLREVVEKLTTDIRIKLEDQNRLIKGHFESGGAYMRDAMSACIVERDLQKREAELAAAGQPAWLERRYVRSFSYENLSGQLANGFPTTGYTAASGSPLGSITHFYTGLKVPATLAAISREYNERFLYIQNLYGILRAYVEQTDKANLPAFEAAYKEALAPSLKFRNEIMLTIHENIKRFGDCDQLLFRHEVQLRAKTMQAEEEYLGWVYDKLTTLEALATEGKEAEATALLDQTNLEIVPTNPGLPAAYKGFDAIARIGNSFFYNFHKLDSKLRLARVLEKLSPATKVSLPNFERLEEYRTRNTQKIVPLPIPEGTPDSSLEAVRKELRQAFIDDGMRLYMGGLVLGESETPYFLLNKMDVLAQLYRLGPVNADGSFGCTENCLEVTPEQIITQTLDVLRLVDLTDYDLRVLALRGLPQKHDDKFWNKISLDEAGRRQIGLLDLTFQRVATDDVDSKDASPVTNGRFTSYFEDLAKIYYQKSVSVGNFLFPPREGVKDMIRDNYAVYVQDYEAKVDGFLAEYRRLQADPNFNVPHVHRTRTEFLEVPTEIVTQDDGKQFERPALLWRERINKYVGLVSDFHKATKREFKKAGSN